MEKLWKLKNIVLTISLLLPLLQLLVYAYYLGRYMKVHGLRLRERIILPVIELMRQDIRTAGMLYQLILNKFYYKK
jgi:hypothetical protein